MLGVLDQDESYVLIILSKPLYVEIIVMKTGELIRLYFEDCPLGIVEADEGLCYVAKDVCAILGYEDYCDVVAQHCMEYARHCSVCDETGDSQELFIVHEDGVSRLVESAPLPSENAKVSRFRKLLKQLSEESKDLRKKGLIKTATPVSVNEQGNEITSLTFEGHTIRVVDTEGKILWVARDVCRAIGHNHSGGLITRYCRPPRMKYSFTTSEGFTKNLCVVDLPDVMRLLVSNRLPAAKRMEQWVIREIIPMFQEKKNGEIVKPGMEKSGLEKSQESSSMGLMNWSFENHGVRNFIIDGEIWWAAKDVCKVLKYKDYINAIKRHCRGVAKRHPITDSLGRDQEVRIINEPDLMRLIIHCRLPDAERFERWVFEEVLPAINRHGVYMMPKVARDVFSDPEKIAQLTALLKEEHGLRVQAEADRSQAEADKDWTRGLLNQADKSQGRAKLLQKQAEAGKRKLQRFLDEERELRVQEEIARKQAEALLEDEGKVREQAEKARERAESRFMAERNLRIEHEVRRKEAEDTVQRLKARLESDSVAGTSNRSTDSRFSREIRNRPPRSENTDTNPQDNK